jgi:hypothetical protein
LKSKAPFESKDFPLQGREALGIYFMLKDRESELDETRLQLMDRLERELYQELSIDEFENIRNLYYKKI